MIRIAQMCPRCGLGVISAGSNRCDRCGYSLEPEAESSTPSPPPRAHPTGPPPPESAAASPAAPGAGGAPDVAPPRPTSGAFVPVAFPPPPVLFPGSLRPFPGVGLILGAALTLSIAAFVERASEPVPGVPEFRQPVVVAPAPTEPAAVSIPEPEPAAAVSADSSQPDSVAPAPEPVEPSTPPSSNSPVIPDTRPGRLFINATPWGQVFIDGVLIGNTPRLDLSVQPGTHRIRVVRYGFEPFEREVTVGPGQTVRLTDIVLRVRQ